MKDRLLIAQKLKTLMGERIALIGDPESPFRALPRRAKREKSNEFWNALSELETLLADICGMDGLVEAPRGHIEKEGKRYRINEQKICEEAGIDYIEYKLNKVRIFIEDSAMDEMPEFAAREYFSNFTNQDSLVEIFDFFATYPNIDVRKHVAAAEYTPISILMKMIGNADEDHAIRALAWGNILFAKEPHPLSENTGFSEATEGQDKHMMHRKSGRLVPKNYKNLFNIATNSSDPVERFDARNLLSKGMRHERQEDTGWYVKNSGRFSLIDGYIPPS
jgi:hypothetical protein